MLVWCLNNPYLYCLSSYTLTVILGKQIYSCFRFPDPKHFFVNFEETIVKYTDKWGKVVKKKQYLYKMINILIK